MNCVECFKKRVAKGAEYTHFGKSLCKDCLPGSIQNALDIVTELEAIQKEFSETQALMRAAGRFVRGRFRPEGRSER